MVPEPHWSPLLDVRRAVASCILRSGAPGPAFEYDANSNKLYQMTNSTLASDAKGDNGWFRPEVYLPEVQVVPLPSSSTALESVLRSTSADTSAALRELRPDIPETLEVLHTALLHAADVASGGGMVSALSELRKLILPGGVPMPAEWGVDASVDTSEAAAAEDGDGGVSMEAAMARLGLVGGGDEAVAVAAAAVAAASAAFQGGVVDVGSSLAEADWNDIDDKDVSAMELVAEEYETGWDRDRWRIGWGRG